MSTGTMKLGIWEATLTGASSDEFSDVMVIVNRNIHHNPDDPALMALAGKMKTSTLEEIITEGSFGRVIPDAWTIIWHESIYLWLIAQFDDNPSPAYEIFGKLLRQTDNGIISPVRINAAALTAPPSSELGKIFTGMFKTPRRLVEDRYAVAMLVAFVNTLETEAPEPGKPCDNCRRFEATNMFPRCHRGNGKIGCSNCIAHQRTQTCQHYVPTPQ